MSVVSSYTILTSSLDDSQTTLSAINAFFIGRWADEAFGRFTEIGQHQRGSKAIQGGVFAFAANYFDDADFVLHLRAIAWCEVDSVRVFRTLENDMGWSEVCLQPLKFPPGSAVAAIRFGCVCPSEHREWRGYLVRRDCTTHGDLPFGREVTGKIDSYGNYDGCFLFDTDEDLAT